MRFVPIALLLAGCAPISEPTPHRLTPAETCDANAVEGMIGRPATAELGVEAMRIAGARSLRWKVPGGVMTMDYRIDRLNVALDERNIVTGFDCG